MAVVVRQWEVETTRLPHESMQLPLLEDEDEAMMSRSLLRALPRLSILETRSHDELLQLIWVALIPRSKCYRVVQSSRHLLDPQLDHPPCLALHQLHLNLACLQELSLAHQAATILLRTMDDQLS